MPRISLSCAPTFRFDSSVHPLDQLFDILSFKVIFALSEALLSEVLEGLCYGRRRRKKLLLLLLVVVYVSHLADGPR